MSMVSGVVGGVDTHADVHVAAAIDENGGGLGVESFPADAAGYESLVVWLVGFGPVSRVGVEGTGSYEVGLSRFLHDQDVVVVEVDRPNRQARRKEGKSDPVDAVAAARAALSGTARVTPKRRDGPVSATPRNVSNIDRVSSSYMTLLDRERRPDVRRTSVLIPDGGSSVKNACAEPQSVQ